MLWRDMTIARIRAGLSWAATYWLCCRITACWLCCRITACWLCCRITACRLRCRQPVGAGHHRRRHTAGRHAAWRHATGRPRGDRIRCLLCCNDPIGASGHRWHSTTATARIGDRLCRGIAACDRLGRCVAPRDTARKSQRVHYALLRVVKRGLSRSQGGSGSGGEGRSGGGVRRGGVGHSRGRLTVCRV